MIEEIKAVNSTPKPNHNAGKPPFWWGRISVDGDSYAKFIGLVPKGVTKPKTKVAPLRLTVKGAHVYRASRGIGSWLDKYEPRRAIIAWAFRDRVYETDPDLTDDDVMALVLENENKKRLRLEKAKALQAMTEHLDDTMRRQPIPPDVRMFVWQRDHGRCVHCGSQRELEFDHIIPVVLGGSNTERNLQLLCAECNRRQGATLG